MIIAGFLPLKNGNKNVLISTSKQMEHEIHSFINLYSAPSR